MGVILLAAGGLFAGCTLLSPSTGDGDRVSCQEDQDCPSAQPLCRQYECVSRCAGVVCSGGGRERCDPLSGRCIPYLGETCGSDENCPREHPRCVSGFCRGDRLDPCRTAPCAPGLSCVLVRDEELCLQPCDAQPCRVGERCLDASFGALAAFCAPNLCRPGGSGVSTLVRSAAYGGACETDGIFDGICLGPLPDPEVGDIGVCQAPGLAPPAAVCSPSAPAGSSAACREGVCSVDAGLTDGTCFGLCSAWVGQECPEGQACHPQWGGQGVCFELLPEAAAAGARCQPPLDGHFLACEEGSICLPLDLEAGERRCLPICDPDAAKTESRACAMGRCVRWDPTGNPFLGVCAEA